MQQKEIQGRAGPSSAASFQFVSLLSCLFSPSPPSHFLAFFFFPFSVPVVVSVASLSPFVFFRLFIKSSLLRTATRKNQPL